MKIYFAPMEGVTDVIYRRVHHACFPGLSKYYIPFISPTQHLTFTSREQAAVSPALNAGIPAVPQILTKNAEHFIHTARALHEAGYDEINLNLGCPSGTVTAKGKGSGMLRDPGVLAAFLDEIFAAAPCAISVKTRIGYDSVEEWPALLELLSRYPISELTVHPRTRRELYGGSPHREAFALALKSAPCPCVYNGDLHTKAGCAALARDYPGTAALMIGRGLVSNPALGREVMGGAPLSREDLVSFHDKLLAAYLDAWPKNAVIGHMHEIMKHIALQFADTQKPVKALRKATTLEAYEDAARRLLDCPFRDADDESVSSPSGEQGA